jgi:hypothetical protein
MTIGGNPWDVVCASTGRQGLVLSARVFTARLFLRLFQSLPENVNEINDRGRALALTREFDHVRGNESVIQRGAAGLLPTAPVN